MRFFDIISEDLFAATKRRGFKAFLSAMIFEPGFSFLFGHRVVQKTYQKKCERIAKLLWRLNSLAHGCYFHITAEIGPGLYLPHPVAIVVGENAKIGSNVTLYQSVTIGKGKGNKYPVIENNVVIFPNSIIFGDLTIGESAVIGAGSIVGKSIPDKVVFKDRWFC